VTSEDERLRRIGIEVIDADVDPRVHTECVRIARRLRLSGRRVFGLWPSGADVAVPPLAIQLGVALVELSGATVAYVDANVRRPAVSELVAGRPRDGDETIFATRWLRGSLALLTPTEAGDAGAGVPQLRRVIERGTELFAHVLVDLTGFDQFGDHLSAVDLVEGVLLVGRAGRTREKELLRLAWQLAPEQNLGVLLVG
jgi:hypothetical protein